MLSLRATLGNSHTFKTEIQGWNLLQCMLVEIAPYRGIAAIIFYIAIDHSYLLSSK